MKAIRTANKRALQYVNAKIPFKGSNTFGRWENNKYIVYSYGVHFPLFIWDGGIWHINSSKYSKSTSRHQRQLHPTVETTYKHFNNEEMIKLLKL